METTGKWKTPTEADIGALVCADPENPRQSERKPAAMEICVCPEFVVTGVEEEGPYSKSWHTCLSGKKNSLPTVDSMKSAFRKVRRLGGPENKPWHQHGVSYILTPGARHFGQHLGVHCANPEFAQNPTSACLSESDPASTGKNALRNKITHAV